MVGGGSGGHITPILAVAAALKRHTPKAKLVYVGQKGDGLGDLPKASPHIDATHSVRAGKLRRYHGENLLQQLTDWRTLLLNLRDSVYVLIGLVQSLRLLQRLRPDVVFIKGGYVGVPVGLAAAALRIPFVTHDSDAVPGLANRIIARWAAVHAVALPKEVYKGYKASKTITTGVPVQAEFTVLTKQLRRQYRQELGLPAEGRVVFVTGGGLGAKRINDAMLAISGELLRKYDDLQLLHLVGRAHETSVASAYDDLLHSELRQRVRVIGYASDLYRYSGAADVVVTRAGATAMAEFAVQSRPCVIVPNPYLTAGHQLKNARYMAERKAGVIVDDERMHTKPDLLRDAITGLLEDPDRAAEFGANLQGCAHPDAADRLAMVLLDQTQA